MTWPVYLITIDQNSPRCRNAIAQLVRDGIEFTIFDGVIGTSLSPEKIKEVYDQVRNRRVAKYPLTKPEIGCFLSHFTIWRKIASSPHAGGFILEDDFESSKDLKAIFSSISKLPLGTDIVSLHKAKWRKSHRPIASITGDIEVVEPWIPPSRTTGYALTRDAASLLVERALPMARPVDLFLKHWWESGIRFLSIEPSPLCEPHALSSDITRARTSVRSDFSKWQRFVRNARYQASFHTSLITARRNRSRSIAVDLTVVKSFKGHSGCEVTLCRVRNDYFVRKVSASADYNNRLLNQIKKQKKMSEVVRAPRVLSEGASSGLVYFDMDYVQTTDFASHLVSSRIADIPRIVDKLFSVLSDLRAHDGAPIATDLFLTKLKSVESALRQNNHFSSFSEVLTTSLKVLSAANWQHIAATQCHGDFTLENILVDASGEITLIDFLDGEIETTWLDIAKLLYDLDCGWSFRSQLWKSPLAPHDRLLGTLCRYLRDEIILRVQSEYPELSARLPQLKMFQALRVLPYIKDDLSFERVTRAVNQYKKDMLQ